MLDIWAASCYSLDMPISNKCGECGKPIKGHKRRTAKAGVGVLGRVKKQAKEKK